MQRMYFFIIHCTYAVYTIDTKEKILCFMCFMYLFRFIDPYRFQPITVNRFLGDVMILMSPLPLRHVVASQVVKEATEAFLFIGAGDAWRALGQQRLSDLSETSGTPGPQNDLTWTERDFLTEQNHPDTAKCI